MRQVIIIGIIEQFHVKLDRTFTKTEMWSQTDVYGENLSS